MLFFLEGVNRAYTLSLTAIEEEVQRISGSFFVPALLQTASIHEAFEYLDRAFQAAGFSLPPAVKIAAWLLPSVATVLRRYTNLHGITYLQDRLIPLALLITSVSSVALMTLGQAILGATTLGVISIFLLSRHRVLPYPIRSFLDKTASLVVSITNFILFGTIEKIKSVLEICLNSSAEVKETIPETDCPLEELNALCEKIQETKDIKAGISNVVNLKLNGSEPKTYTILTQKLKQIAAYLKEAPLEEQERILTDLGNSSYGYSGALIWTVDRIYGEKIASKDPIKYALQQLRDEIVEKAIYHHFDPLISYPFLKHPLFSLVTPYVVDFFNPWDIHTHYLYINIVAPHFGLTHTHGAETDQMALSDSVVELGLKIYNYRVVQEIKRAYTKEAMLERVRPFFPSEDEAVQYLST